MDLNRLRGLVAAPIASLLLILALCTVYARRPVSTGIRIPMVRIRHIPQEPTDCGGGSKFLKLAKDGKTWINNSEIPADRLTPSIATLMETRAERVVYVVVDSELSYGQFARFVDKIAGATSDLHVVVISGEVRRALEKSHDMCDLYYRTDEFTPLR